MYSYEASDIGSWSTYQKVLISSHYFGYFVDFSCICTTHGGGQLVVCVAKGDTFTNQLVLLS